MITLIKSIESDQRFRFLWELKAHRPEVRIYLVGGLVRDALLGRESTDYDFIIENIKPDTLERFLEKHGKIVADSNTKTAVYKFLPDNQLPAPDSRLTIDIALPRIEEYEPTGSRTPIKVITHGVSLEDDLSRRDFTINAMAVELLTPRSLDELGSLSTLNFRLSTNLIDPFKGLTDLKAGIIRAVGDPAARFHEDPLRILRAVRFACQLGFQIEAITLAAAKATSHQILEVLREKRPDSNRHYEESSTKQSKGKIATPPARDDKFSKTRISAERIQKEFILSLVHPACFFDLWDKIGLFQQIMPEVGALKGVPQPENWHSEGDCFVHTRLAISKLPRDSSTALVLGTLLHDIGKATTFQSAEETGDRIRFNDHDRASAEMAYDILNRLRFDNKTIEEVVWLAKNHMRLLLGFPKMKLSKQKALILNPYFENLVKLTTADASASLTPTGQSISLDFITQAKAIQSQIKAAVEAGKPLEIINGNQIMKLLNEADIKYDGILVGRLKIEINEAYADEKINSFDQAKKLVIKLVNK